MSFERAQFELRPFLVAIVPRPDGEGRSFRVLHAKLGDAGDDLEQPAGHAAGGADHPAVGRDLAEPQDHRDEKRRQAEAERDRPQSGVVEEDDAEDRQQEDAREQAVGNGPLQAVAKILERHSRHRHVAGRMAAQNARREPHQAVPEGGFDPGSPASLEPHHRGALEQVQEGAEQAEPRHRQGQRVERSGVSTRRRVMSDESEREGGRQLDQAGRQPGSREPRQVRRRPAQGNPEQIRRFHGLRRQWPIEDPGFLREGGGAIRADPLWYARTEALRERWFRAWLAGTHRR